MKWSGRRDLNSRPLAPQASALPGCATTFSIQWVTRFSPKICNSLRQRTHTSLSVPLRLGSGKGFPSSSNLVALSLMCSIVECKSCDSSWSVASKSPSVVTLAFAQSLRIRSSILRSRGGMRQVADVTVTRRAAIVGCSENRSHSYRVRPTKTSSLSKYCDIKG
jgi:hypothetical protein